MAQERSDPLADQARAAAEGDRKAQRILLRAVSPAMVGVIRTMVASSSVEDVAQEALLGFVKALPRFRYQCTVKHFACRVAVQTATVANRSKRRRSAAYDRLAREDQGSSRSPAAVTAQARRIELIKELLEQLPEEQAQTLSLRVVLGCSLEEVADATGVPINTVRSRIRLARQALRKRIEADPALSALIERGEP